ncbi:hypothetical protein JOB18_021803 [Solea senegalensis]|uniref:Uncharacterized protein n=1 Tax=Solea senegalensis TaxID=28829 RepID=A0AAV6SZ86_SOLSE|nr:hypothetical protein JOB18_021803 [Solea senegalensis]
MYMCFHRSAKTVYCRVDTFSTPTIVSCVVDTILSETGLEHTGILLPPCHCLQ